MQEPGNIVQHSRLDDAYSGKSYQHLRQETHERTRPYRVASDNRSTFRTDNSAGRGGGNRGEDGRDSKRHPGRMVLVIFVGVALIATVAFFMRRRPRPLAPPAPAAKQASVPAVEAGILPWSLSAPVSREVALPGGNGQILIFGGLTSGGRSAPGVYSLNTETGRLVQKGNLARGLHDAAGVRFGGEYFIFGGGAVSTLDTIEAVDPAKAMNGVFSGTLSRPRSDGAAVVVGRAAYLLGGYSGSPLSSADGAVLATADGSTFSKVAQLPVPVRYPAAVTFGGLIYLFGGIGPAGVPVRTVQVVDPQTGTARKLGKLPLPLEGAVAAAVGGHIYLAGGATTASAAAAAGDRAAADAALADPHRLLSVATVWSYQRAGGRFLIAGRLPLPVANGASVVVGKRVWMIGGEYRGKPVADVQMFTPNPAFGIAGRPGAGSPYYGGKLLVADRGNNRLLLLNDLGRIVWRFPNAQAPPPPTGFFFPDDAFFEQGGRSIIVNQERNDTIVRIAFPSGKLLWSYGHAGHPGSTPGYLHEPDDALLLPGGKVSVADAYNCRILIIDKNGSTAGQIGTTGLCRHDPPKGLGEPNGATPLPNGDFLISEIRGSWVSEYTAAGEPVWEAHLPIAYPSDPQQIGPDRYLVADYTRPGAIIEFNRHGRILYRYQPRSGPGMLDHPSLVELLPSGVFMVNDDYHDRMVAIDPTTGALVWQYGAVGRPGSAPGRLSTPDGFDLLMPGGSTPTHVQG